MSVSTMVRDLTAGSQADRDALAKRIATGEQIPREEFRVLFRDAACTEKELRDAVALHRLPLDVAALEEEYREIDAKLDKVNADLVAARQALQEARAKVDEEFVTRVLQLERSVVSLVAERTGKFSQLSVFRRFLETALQVKSKTNGGA